MIKGLTVNDPLNWETKTFSFTDQNNNSYGSENLKGKVWIADFLFTSCETVCTPMTANMSKLQKMVKEEKLDVEFVSFSVDPTIDTPVKLQAYINVDESKWHLLTGYSQSEIEKFASSNFNTIAKKPEGSNQVIHATKFYLIDKNGIVMKDYSGLSDVPYENIIEDIKILQK